MCLDLTMERHALLLKANNLVEGNNDVKVRLSPSKEKSFICFNDSPSKIMKNDFFFILKALFVLKIFKLLS